MYYGFDIGGTKIALGVFDKNLKLQWETRVPTPRESYDEFLTAIAALVAQADERFGVKGSVGIGIPGMPETDDGTLYAANVPAASGKPLRADLSALLERDVRLDNDANCFALSEAWDDEFRRYPLVMGLILGTGVGGGIVVNGKPITGRSYITGEFGHIRLPVDALEVVGRDFPLTRCGCGQHGCIENYLSGRGFAWLYEHFYHQKLEAPQIITLWEQGDAQAREHVERYLDLLAVCLGNILTIVDPDLLVIGGGLSNFTAITERLSGRLPRHLLPVARVPRIERARHGDAGGMRGAAFLHLTEVIMLSRRQGRLSRFRKNKRRLRERLRQRIFFRDRIMPEAMDKPRVVVLTGAGISAESGIRTFRAADGLWEEHRVEDVATPEGFARDPDLVQAFYNARRRQLLQPEIAPNAAHLALAKLEEALGDRFLLVTQNIDNLHERAGNKNIIHMHGELLKVRCAWSGQVLDWKEDVLPEDKCHCCQFPSRLRPHVVWFGEMPLGMDEIYSALAMADVFIAIGTSGHVYPAAGFVHEARLHGAHTVELNLEPSQVGSEFEEKHYGLASAVVPEFVDKLLKGL